MNKQFWIKIIAVSGFLSVALGAFAAHGLESVLSDRRMDTFQTAAQYQIFHTLALLGIICTEDGLLQVRCKIYLARCFVLGIILFSGSLYLLAITDISALGMLAPIGGSAFIIGWAILFIEAIRSK